MSKLNMDVLYSLITLAALPFAFYSSGEVLFDHALNIMKMLGI